MDAAEAGFDDEALYQELKCELGDRSLPIAQIDRDDALLAFSDWRTQVDRTPY